MPGATTRFPQLKGYVHRFDDRRIEERLQTEDTFTDVFGYGEVPQRQLALIAFDGGTLDALAAMVRGSSVASYERVVRFSSVVLIEPRLEVEEVLDEGAVSYVALARTQPAPRWGAVPVRAQRGTRRDRAAAPVPAIDDRGTLGDAVHYRQ
jgi:hypothetical protein